jgi:hypothetical protein
MFASPNYSFPGDTQFTLLNLNQEFTFQENVSYKIVFLKSQNILGNNQYNADIYIYTVTYSGLKHMLTYIIKKILDNKSTLGIPFEFIMYVNIIIMYPAMDYIIKNTITKAAESLSILYPYYTFQSQNNMIHLHKTQIINPT